MISTFTEKLAERNRRKVELMYKFSVKHAFVFFFGGLAVSILVGLGLGLLLSLVL